MTQLSHYLFSVRGAAWLIYFASIAAYVARAPAARNWDVRKRRRVDLKGGCVECPFAGVRHFASSQRGRLGDDSATAPERFFALT
eukprot:9231552-Pyramimonas_sp.AAC.1